MSEAGLYERVLARIGGEASLPPPRPPRPSASVVLWRRQAGGGIRVFWIERARTQRFMGGWHAFPGGGIGRADRGLPVRGVPAGVDRAPADGAMPPAILEGAGEIGPILQPGLVGGLLRELFEETGVLLTRSAEEPGGIGRDGLEPLRQRIVGGELEFADLVRERGWELDASRLVYAGRWLTPPLGPLRFDNRFFLLEWPEVEPLQPHISTDEAESGEWIDPAEALASWDRGEVLAAPPILHILRVLKEESLPGGLERLREPVEQNLGDFRRIEFRPGVLLFPLRAPTLPPATHTNAYLLGFGDSVLVDPGAADPAEIERLTAALAAAEERLGRRVVKVWLTHHHPDHVGGVSELKRRLRVPVAAHPVTAERLRGRGIVVDERLEGGEVLDLGGEPAMTLAAIHTPGHARGHLCLFDRQRGSLIAGDMVAGFGTIVIDPPEGDMDDYLRSLEVLETLEPRTLFPAHGPVLRDGTARLAAVRRHRLWREDRVLEAWRSGVRDPSAMLERVYDDAPAEALPLAERQLQAHLDRLRRLGRLED